MRALSSDIKHGVRAAVLPAFALFLLVSCSAATSGGVQGGVSNCGKPKTVTGKTTTSKPSGLMLTDSSSGPWGQPAVGGGFIDITTSDASNTPLQKRCTMNVRPIDASDTSVRVWTAGHCSFDPFTVEFEKSKYTLQIYLDGGYFTVPVVFTDLEETAQFSKSFAALMDMPFVPAGVRENVSNALPRAQASVCQAEETKFRSTLGSNAKNVACFNRSEMRGMKATLQTDATTAPLLNRVMTEVRNREKSVMDQLSSDFKSVVDAYLISHSSEQRRRADLRGLSYLLNTKFCSATSAERPPSDDPNTPDSTALCPYRDQIISQLTISLSTNDLAVASGIYSDTSRDLTTLRKATLGCNGYSATNLPAGLDLTMLTACDMGNISVSFWNSFVDQGPQIPSGISSSSFGLTANSYYGFYTNNIPSTGSSDVAKSLAKIFSLNSSSVLSFEYALRSTSKSNNTFLINYDAATQQINPVKGASGSILAIFGVIPVGLLSTVDGEATSGGASIIPLPQVGDEDEAVPVSTSKSNVGC
ncbi:MAG: hypothetical protein RIR26_551 [Pseudomonadota bacterium]